MLRIRFIQSDGTERDVEVDAGTSVMRAAVDNGVEGIIGECGGLCACGTCHCYVADDWLPRLREPMEVERQMLNSVPASRKNSRLGCQIELEAGLDGLTVSLPESQY